MGLFRFGFTFLNMALALSLLNSSADAKLLHARVAEPPTTLDWTGQATIIDARLIMNVSEGLFGFQYPGEKLVPQIAASLKKSKDFTEYTFKIREDAKWSDGRTVYAKDFVDGWQRVISPQTTSIYSYYFFDIVNAYEYFTKKITSFDDVGIHATDDRTLVVKLKRAQKEWEVNTTFWPFFPIRKDRIEKFGESWWRAGTLVSTGPFVFSNYEPGKKAVLKRNPYYKKAATNITEIEIDFISNQDDALKKYRENYYPYLANVPKDFFKNKDYHPTTMMRHHVLAMNTERFPFNNKMFRLAFLSAIDRKQLMPEKNDHFTLAKTLIPPALLKSDEDLTVPYNVKKAKEYLTQSGIVLSKGFKITIIAGFVEPFHTMAKKIATQVESNLGVNVEIAAYNSQEFETFSNLGEYDAVMISWTNKVRSAQDFLFPYSSYSPNNRTHFNKKEYDDFINQGKLKDAQLFISRQNGVIHPLFFEKKGFLMHSNTRGLQFDFHGLPLYKDMIIP